jgi:N utilization substance protein B
MTRTRSSDPRRRAREIALQILYHWEIGRTDVATAADTYFDLQWAGQEPPPAELRSAATELAHETVRRLSESDALIAETAERWRPERMAVLDRLILRLAIAEMLRAKSAATVESADRDGTPPAVVINEAMELARTFSTEEAVKFINGMLDAIRKKLDDAAETTE